jgi:hypothetical protein
MVLPSLASVDDLKAWQGSPVDLVRASAVLAAASTLIRAHTGRVWVDADGPEDVSETAAAVVRTVCVMVADRVYRNPEMATQQTSGPFSMSVSEWASRGLVLTPDERALLATAAGRVPGLSSVRVEVPAEASGTYRPSGEVVWGL